VQRETINLGVIGMMRAGKSTLLRSITGLGRDVIPSAELDATTAALSRIVNRPGPPTATLSLHSWESFRDEYLAPLHESAKCGPAPATVGELERFAYPEPSTLTDDEVMERQFLKKLHEAQDSLTSYVGELTGGRADVPIGRLRPYVAYPEEDDPQQNHRPYHAVREILIETEFPEVPAARIGLVDLPGAGEAGLDVDRHFLGRLHNDVDLLMMVKSPGEKDAGMTAADWKIVDLAKDARCGVPMEHFFVAVLNRRIRPDDQRPDREQKQKRYDFAHAKVSQALAPNGVRVLGANADLPDEVRADIVMPVLDHLAADLVDMDHMATAGLVRAVAAVAADIGSYADAVLGSVSAWRSGLGDQEKQLLEAADLLRLQIGADLEVLMRTYDARATEAEPDSTMIAAIDGAERSVREWLPTWFASDPESPGGSRIQFTSLERGEIVQDEYRAVRRKVRDTYGSIDLSRRQAMADMYADVVRLLRAKLTDNLVGDPADPGALAQLKDVAHDAGADLIAAAIAELLTLEDGYGSLVVRVAQPIIRQLDWERDPQAADAGKEMSREDLARQRLGLSPVSSREGARVPDRMPPRNPDELMKNITEDVDVVMSSLRTALSAEAMGLSQVLASSIELLLDRMVKTNRIELDYRSLCSAHRVEIWPARFGGSPARTAEALVHLTTAARDVKSAAARLPGATK
jgi:hypothetical protein